MTGRLIAAGTAWSAVMVATQAAAHVPDTGATANLPVVHWAAGLALVSLGVYAAGVRRLWRHAGAGRGIAGYQAAAFVLGIALLLIALSTRLEVASDKWLVAHMVQHVLMIAFAPALIAIGRPDVALVWTIPERRRSMFARRAAPGKAGRALAGLTRPVPAALVHAGAVWVWHVPAAYEAALDSRILHDLEHLTFFASAMLFWYGLTRAVRLKEFVGAMGGLLITMINGGFLGALLAFAGRPLYGHYTGSPVLTALQDQHLAGLAMWVPAGAVCLAAALIVVDRTMPRAEGTKSPVRSSGAPSS